jgi:hypothetical protein
MVEDRPDLGADLPRDLGPGILAAAPLAIPMIRARTALASPRQ